MVGVRVPSRVGEGLGDDPKGGELDFGPEPGQLGAKLGVDSEMPPRERPGSTSHGLAEAVNVKVGGGNARREPT